MYLAHRGLKVLRGPHGYCPPRIPLTKGSRKWNLRHGLTKRGHKPCPGSIKSDCSNRRGRPAAHVCPYHAKASS